MQVDVFIFMRSLAAGLCLVAGTALQAQSVPTFQSGVVLRFSDQCTLQTDDSNVIAAPHVSDWNGDGQADLIVGYFVEGAVYFFENSGSGTQPVYIRGAGWRLEADKVPISVEYG